MYHKTNIMKKVLLLAAVFCFTLQSNFSLAQSDPGTPKGISNSLSIDIQHVSKRDTEKAWKDMIKKYDGKTKKGKNNEWYTEEVDVPKLGPEGTIKMFMTINEKDRVASTTFRVSRDGEFINHNDDPEGARIVESMFQDFVYEMKKESLENETEVEEKQLKDLNKDLEKLEKNNRKYHEEIEKCKKKIAEMESNILKNEDDQISKKEEIAAQKETVENVLSKVSKHRR